MIYDALLSVIQKHLYVVYRDTFYNETTHTYLERIIAKHPLLKPRFIVLNDEVQGFKKMDEKVSSLEKFPIYIEFEYQKEEGVFFLDSIDMYAESKIRYSDHSDDIAYLANIYNKTVQVERVSRFTDLNYESLIISSLIQKVNDDYSVDLEGDDEEGGDDSSVSTELVLMLDVYMVSFLNFIKMMNEVLVKGVSLDQLDHVFQSGESNP